MLTGKLGNHPETLYKTYYTPPASSFPAVLPKITFDNLQAELKLIREAGVTVNSRVKPKSTLSGSWIGKVSFIIENVLGVDELNPTSGKPRVIRVVGVPVRTGSLLYSLDELDLLPDEDLTHNGC